MVLSVARPKAALAADLTSDHGPEGWCSAISPERTLQYSALAEDGVGAKGVGLGEEEGWNEFPQLRIRPVASTLRLISPSDTSSP